MRARGARTTAWLLGAAVVLIWGVSFTATRVAVAEVPPLTAALLRFGLASLVLWPVVRRRWGTLRLERPDRKDGWLLGLSGVTLSFLFENVGLKFTTASHGALIVSTAPLATAMAEAVLHRRLPRPRVLAGFVAALAGVGLIVGLSRGGGATWFGDLMVLGTVCCWVVYSFLTRRLVGRYPTLVVTQVAMVTGTVLLFPLAGVELLVVPVGRPGVLQAAAIAYLGVLCSAVAYLWWNRAIAVLGVTATNSLVYGIPLVGVLAGIVLLGEPLTPIVLAGGALIVGGVVVANTGDREGP
ncbi:MAG: DMT family transporter [Acidobacteria bacterium]|nr:DMT family transporter [Acidobacteriota bacterium]